MIHSDECMCSECWAAWGRFFRPMPDYPVFYPADVWAQTDLYPIYGNTTRFTTSTRELFSATVMLGI
jgi:hypothetical protein